MNYRIRHSTRYQYALPVSHCYNLAYVVPRNTDRQQVDAVDIHISPGATTHTRHSDYFGNQFLQFSIEKAHSELEVCITSNIIMRELSNSINLDFGNPCSYVKYLLQHSKDWETLCAREFMLDSPMVQQHADLADYAASSFSDERPFLSAVLDLTQRIFTDFSYDPEFSDIATPLADVFKHKRGVCQDFAHLAIGCLRSLGYPARYVSGYLETQPAPGQQKLIGADATHAWFAVYSPGEGWYEFDPTNNQLTSAQHITTAWGRDYSDVTPLKGVIFGGGISPQLLVSVDVQRIEDDSFHLAPSKS
uniref:transglutaminase family protein n=1 Tax=Cellvibrio fontiphilus TaxID=1815559 RepID=UPI002B4BF7BA|nr:transglutaminase family protein [Cellvibrio fontiphilus]